jgi:hypothetical protein
LILAQVHHRQHRTVGEQEVGPQEGPLRGVEAAAVEGCACGKRRLSGIEGGDLVGQRPVGPGCLAALGDLVLHRFEVGQGELQLEDPKVLERIVRARYLRVGEGPQEVDDGVHLADVGQEAVAEPLALAGTFDQPADVDELHARRHHVAAGRHGGEGVQAPVEHLGHAHVGVAGREGVGRGQRTAPRERVVERRLARIGEANEPEPFHVFEGTGDGSLHPWSGRSSSGVRVRPAPCRTRQACGSRSPPTT